MGLGRKLASNRRGSNTVNEAAVRKPSIRRHLALAILMAVFAGDPALARSGSAKTTASKHILFTCHADYSYDVQPSRVRDTDNPFEATSPRSVDEEVSLVVDVKSRRMSLIIQVEGGQTGTHLLDNVEQGSSFGSGAGGRADTTIRGGSDGKVYTLFASYDSNGFDHDATLQVSGITGTLLACDSDMYEAPRVEGLGRFGSTSIYALAADGLVGKIDDLPVEPAIRDHP